MKVYETQRKTGITRSLEFERKGLAAYGVNVGTKCGHSCLYCSTGTVLRTHRSFQQVGRSPFEHGYAIVDPETPERVREDARRYRGRRGMVQLCTLTDAWSPEAQKYDLGRRCLEAILSESDWIVRILTKNAAVANDFDLIKRHRDRVLLGLTLTATPDKSDVMAVVEPLASSIRERMQVLRQAHRRGLRTYAMLCPLLPGVSDAPEQIDEFVRFAVETGAEEIFSEPVNARGSGLRLTQEALEQSGYVEEAAAVGRIRRQAYWSQYATDLISNMQRSVRAHFDITRLRMLLYPSNLTAESTERISNDDAGIVWLGKD